MSAPTTPKVLKPLLWSFVTLLLVLCWNARASAGETGSRSARPLRADQAIGIVHEIYDKAELYTAASGTPVEFAVSDCRAIYRRDFSREAYTGLFDLAPSRVLQLAATVFSDRGLGVAGASFQAEWIDAPHADHAAGVLAAVQGDSVQEVLDWLRKEDKAFDRRIEPIVSCGVTVTAEGESRSYRAAFLFSPGAGDAPQFWADHVVHGLSRLASETLPPVRDLAELRRRADPNEAFVNQMALKVTTPCVEDQESGSNPFITQRDWAEHTEGSHASQLGFGGTCTETLNCVSKCTPNLRLAACQDDGKLNSVFKVHQVYKDQAVEGDQQPNAGSICKAALGCAIQSCIAGLCQPLTLSLGARGAEGGFTVGGGTPLWNGSTVDRFACPAPKAEPLPTITNPKPAPINPVLSPTGGGGEPGSGGGFGSAGGCSWVCVTTSVPGAGYSESCSLSCSG